MIEKKSRIAKIIAASGLCSRRQAEVLINEGKVSVNGTKILSPALTVTEKDQVEVEGKRIVILNAPQTRLWCYYKPTGLLTTHRDPQGRPTIFNALPPDLPRLISIGRLDINSEGLLLLTNDGGFARSCELPINGLPRHYRVRVRGRIIPHHLQQLRKGITIEGISYAPIESSIENQQTSNAWINFILKEGKNREIRKICKHFGWPVNRLIRTRYGIFDLQSLKPGQLREIPQKLIAQQKSFLCTSPAAS